MCGPVCTVLGYHNSSFSLKRNMLNLTNFRWWNSSVEQQAFCRVYRIGQVEETSIVRFVVKNTVDETLENMQSTKDEAIETAMDDNKVLGKLSVQELMKIFGPVGEDENRKPFILIDKDDEYEESPFPILEIMDERDPWSHPPRK